MRTAARNHVNRLCLAAGVTLVESGSAGYLGQVTVIRKVSPFEAHSDWYGHAVWISRD